MKAYKPLDDLTLGEMYPKISKRCGFCCTILCFFAKCRFCCKPTKEVEKDEEVNLDDLLASDGKKR